MPTWQFLVVRQYGRLPQRRKSCLRIKQHVVKRGLSNVLPLVKYELGAQNEYYLGLAIDTDASINGVSAEDAARRLLVDAGISAAANRQLSPLLEPNQGKGLLRGTLECESFTVPITYEPEDNYEATPTDSLLADSADDELKPIRPGAGTTGHYYRLLSWCSAVGSGELARMRQVCAALGIDTEWGGAWSILRRFVLMGHLEFDGGRSFRWSVIPPTLVSSLEDDTRNILVGQRTPAIVDYLRERYHLEEHPQQDGPSLMLVQDPGDEIFYKLGTKLQHAGCVSRLLSELLPPIERWTGQLPTWEERDLGRFYTEEYDRDTDEFHRISAIVGKPRMGLYRFTSEQSARRVVTVAFFDDRTERWICGDYYGLRFVARAHYRPCCAVYRKDTHELVMPATDAWPMPYERALVLASGLLPQRFRTESGTFALVYQGLTPDFVVQIGKLLRLQLESMR